MSLKRAGLVTLLGQAVKGGILFAGLIVFSHLLSPHDIGLIGMLTVFIMLGELLRDFGLSQAAIQSAELTGRQASNLFWTNTLVGLLMTSLLWFAAPAVAHMYHEPALRQLAPWVALSFTINGLQTQFQVRLARDFRFVALTVTDVVSQLAGFIAGLTAALAGASYWSLVIQMLTIYGVLAVQRALIAGWFPGLPRREPGMSALYTFGFHAGSAQLIQYVASNIDSYIIGIRWGASSLGLYNRAFQMFSVPANQILPPLTNVALPILSRHRHDGHDFYPLLWKAQVAISSGLVFVFAAVASMSVPVIRVCLGPAWHASAPILSILCVGGAVQILSYMAYWAFLASGNARQLFFHSLVTKPLLAICIVIGSLWHLEGVAWGFSTGLTVSWFISLVWLAKCDDMPAMQFLRSGLNILGCGLAAGVASWLVVVKLDTHFPAGLTITVGLLVAFVVYVPLLLSFSRERHFLLEFWGDASARIKTLRGGGTQTADESV